MKIKNHFSEKKKNIEAIIGARHTPAKILFFSSPT